MVCIASGTGTCPSADWPDIAVVMTLIVAIAGYKAFKLWVRHRYPLIDEDESE